VTSRLLFANTSGPVLGHSIESTTAKYCDPAGREKSVQWEIDDHLRSAYEAHLAQGVNPENAWRLARRTARVHAVGIHRYKCLILRQLDVFRLIGNWLPISRKRRIVLT
jgi:hypothetical protein